MMKAYLSRYIVPVVLVFGVSVVGCLVFQVDGSLLRKLVIDESLLLVGMVLGSFTLWWFLCRVWLRDADQWKVLIDGVIACREKGKGRGNHESTTDDRRRV